MTIEYIRYRIPADQADAFLAAYQEASAFLDRSEHCLGYELARGLEEPENWILRIEWDSLEGHEQGFRKSADFRKFFVLVRPFFDAIEEMKHYEVSTVSRAAR